MTPRDSAAPRPRAATRLRRDELLHHVHAGTETIEALADRFGVSASTVRRDIAALAEAGHVLRTYGGATASGHLQEPSLQAKRSTHPEEKDRIGRRAAELVDAGDVLLLDAGTTVGRLAWHLRQRSGITVVTNGISALLALMDAPEVEVIVLGGRLRRPNEALLGSEVSAALRHFRPDLAFLGADGVDARRGVNCPSFEQASLKKQMAASARRTWVLADREKLGAEPYPYWSPLPAGAGLVTDAADSESVAMLSGRGWPVLDAAGGSP